VATDPKGCHNAAPYTHTNLKRGETKSTHKHTNRLVITIIRASNASSVKSEKDRGNCGLPGTANRVAFTDWWSHTMDHAI
jgi:hypothetical protein